MSLNGGNSMWQRRRFLYSLAAAFAASPAAARQDVPTSPDQAPRMDAAEVKRLVEKGEAVLVDVRSKEAWDAGHAEGAVHVPVDDIANRMKDLPKDKLIAAYCT
jgi:3-mercaptopyruvate sulfurtransferase SseA